MNNFPISQGHILLCLTKRYSVYYQVGQKNHQQILTETADKSQISFSACRQIKLFTKSLQFLYQRAHCTVLLVWRCCGFFSFRHKNSSREKTLSRTAASEEEEEESCSQDLVPEHTRTEETLPFQPPEQFVPFYFLLHAVRFVCLALWLAHEQRVSQYSHQRGRRVINWENNQFHSGGCWTDPSVPSVLRHDDDTYPSTFSPTCFFTSLSSHSVTLLFIFHRILGVCLFFRTWGFSCFFSCVFHIRNSFPWFFYLPTPYLATPLLLNLPATLHHHPITKPRSLFVPQPSNQCVYRMKNNCRYQAYAYCTFMGTLIFRGSERSWQV